MPHPPNGSGRGARRPALRSLPARLTLFVFWATVITSLTVTAISVDTTQRFLRENIDRKFPSLARRTAERVDLWYDQRVLEIGAFAGNRIPERGLRDRAGAAEAADRSLEELEQYLRYLLDSFPQYRALLALDARGRTVAWVGERLALPAALRERAARARAPTLSALVEHEGERIQLASAGVGERSGPRLGTLHAVLDVAALEGALAAPEAERAVRSLIVDRGGRVLVSDGADAADRFRGNLPEGQDGPVMIDAIDDRGRRVIGSALALGRFGWTLVVQEPYDEAFAPVLASVSRILAIDLAIVVLFGLGAYRIAVSIVKPIDALSDAARRVSEGADPTPLPERGASEEVGLLIRTFNTMTANLASKASELEQSRHEVEEANRKLTQRNEELQGLNEILEQLSITDGLTKLHNHRYFQDQLAREVRRAERAGDPLALVLADIDHFKAWNDRLGHAAGDRILGEVAHLLNGVIRETDLLARYGGEEFALLAPDTDLEGAVALAEKMRAAVGRYRFALQPPGEQEQVTLSFGVAVFRGDRETFFDDADAALYAAKAAGRDCVMTADDAGATGSGRAAARDRSSR